MPNLFFLIFMYFTQWLILYSYAKVIYERRNRFTVSTTLLLFVGLLLTYRFLPTVEALNVVFSLLCNILCFYLGFKSTFKSACFHGLILAITQFVSEVAAIYMISFLSDSSNDSYKESIVIYMLDVLTSKMIYLLISRFLLRFSNRENSTKSWGNWASLSVLPISSLFIIVTMRILTNGQTFTFFESMLCILSISALLTANIVVYLLYEKSERSSQKLIELELVTQKDKIDMQYLDLLEKKNEQMQVMAHDYKNNLSDIASISDSEEIKDFIRNMIGEIQKNSQTAKTKNRILDVLLSKYADICDQKGIQFTTEIITDNLSFFTNYELSSLFNNLLDNAVESAEKSKERKIYLSISAPLGSYHKISITNSCDEKPESKNGLLITKKTDKTIHGLGTKSIHKIVSKYGGEIQWEFVLDKNQFKMTIIIPMSTNNNNDILI